MQPVPNHYETLGVDKDATLSQIKKAYKRLAKVHHPDKKIHQNNAEDHGPRMSVAYDFKRLQEAYGILSNEELRAEYDEEYRAFAAEAERIARQAAKERAKKEAERAKEEALREEKRQKEERRRARKAQKEADRIAREKAELEETEKLSEELFVQQLYNDFGEAGDAAVFEMRSIDPDSSSEKASHSQEQGASPEADSTEKNGATKTSGPKTKISESDLKTPSQFISEDPRLSDPRISENDMEPQDLPRESISNLAEQMATTRFSDPVIDEGTPGKVNNPTLSQINGEKKRLNGDKKKKKKHSKHRSNEVVVPSPEIGDPVLD